MTNHRMRCAVQVDVDPFGVLLRYYGHANHVPPEPFYDAAMPRLLELFARHGVSATFFIVGSDVCGAAGEWLPRLAAAGHEIASHSMHHPFGMTRLPLQTREAELAEAEEAIARWMGTRPVGFRSPGYDVDEPLLDLLQRRGYLYDSSVFPTILAPAIRCAQAFIRMRQPAEHGTMGRLAFLRAPRHPYQPARGQLWQTDRSRDLVELPVGTLTVARLPFYATFHLMGGWPLVAGSLPWLGAGDLVFALHAVDVLGVDRDSIDTRLLGHPGLRQSSARKLALFDRTLAALGERYEFVTSHAMAAAHRVDMTLETVTA